MDRFKHIRSKLSSVGCPQRATRVLTCPTEDPGDLAPHPSRLKRSLVFRVLDGQAKRILLGKHLHELRKLQLGTIETDEDPLSESRAEG